MDVPREQLLEYLATLECRYARLEQQAAEQMSGERPNPKAYQQVSKDLAALRGVVGAYRTFRRLEREISEAEGLLRGKSEPELHELANEELI